MVAEATQNATQERLASMATALILVWSTTLVDRTPSATRLETGLSAAAEVATEEMPTPDAEWLDAAVTTIAPLIGLALTPSVSILASAPATADQPAHRSPLACQGENFYFPVVFWEGRILLEHRVSFKKVRHNALHHIFQKYHTKLEII